MVAPPFTARDALAALRVSSAFSRPMSPRFRTNALSPVVPSMSSAKTRASAALASPVCIARLCAGPAPGAKLGVMTVATPPGPRINMVLAVIAQMLPRLFPFDPLVFGLANARTYGDIVYYKVGPLRVYQVSHPDFARQVLVEEPEKFHKPRLIKNAFRPFAGEGLLTSDGALWKQQRKLIQPAFNHASLATYAGVMVRHASRAADQFTAGRAVELQAEMSALTLPIVVECLFGGDVTQYATEVSGLMVAVLDASNHRLNSALRLPAWVPTPRHLRERRALGRLDQILRELIAARRASPDGRSD